MSTPAARLAPAALLLLLLPPAAAQASPPDPEEAFMRTIRVTRWDDPASRPETYAEWRAAMDRAGRLLDGPFNATRIYRSPAQQYASGKRFDIFVHSSLGTALDTRLKEYIKDIEAEGWAVTRWSCSGGAPVEVRTFLQGRYTTDKLLGCLIVGDLPVPWFEMDDDFNNRHSEFPSDLFYMDMDGTWGDADKDGKYDSHTANEQPEIFVGRLTASPLAGSWGTEASLVDNYFRKLHDFRLGKMAVPRRALAFQDDDWYTMNTGQQNAYGTVVKVTDKAETIEANYVKRLKESYESVVVCAHSSPSGHSFAKPGGSGGRLDTTELWALDPPCLFYNLFACSNARYTSTRYMGGVYIFVKQMGIIALGTTKTGSMLYFDDYYQALGRKDCFGESFRYWFAQRHPYSRSDVRWFYGMTLLGDPTVRLGIPGDITAYGKGCPGTGTVQKVTTVAPGAYASRWGESYGYFILGYLDHRYQQVIDATTLPTTFTATGLALRHDNQSFRCFDQGFWAEVSMKLGYSANAPLAMNTTFSANVSGTMTAVLDKRKVFPPTWTGTNTSLGDWVVKIPFDRPFNYQAQAGKHLLFESSRSGSSAGSTSSYAYFDGVYDRVNYPTSRMYGSGATATTGYVTTGYGMVLGFTQPSTAKEIPQLAGRGTPELGNTVYFDLSRAKASTSAAMILGFSRTSWAGNTLPLDLGFLGAGGCSLLAGLDLMLLYPVDGNGLGSLGLPLPLQASMLKQQVHLQSMILDPAANPAGLAWTNGVTLTIGGRP